ncbi:CidA/LrgA family protein [Burkholderiaceae bacterium FT117]|uniref:CidA/LrgA family protein n=1 Tax=Zeimonas sediminis TaxID=2944268 RepID=UPI002342EC4E|nr:CidA/LrgA family protein [Zeimonas sediminis]MCM5571598.1 CidA/LrgA family protein [Zeimonas sediminis]
MRWRRALRAKRHVGPPVACPPADPRKAVRATLTAVGCLLVLVAACEAAVAMVGLPVPGSLVALAILFLRFHRRGGPDEHLARVFDGTIQYLPLLFVPAGVGILAEGHLMIGAALSYGVAILGGTVLTMVAVGHAIQGAMRLLDRPRSRTRSA